VVVFAENKAMNNGMLVYSDVGGDGGGSLSGFGAVGWEGEMMMRRSSSWVWRRRRGSEMVKHLCTARTLLYIHYFKS
jgi:hypothetical protein